MKIRDNIPNILSCFRLFAAPFLVYLAWQALRDYFLILLAITLLTDAVDGMIARYLKVTSEVGARLDSWGDLATYLTVPFCVWLLWPEIFMREIIFVSLVVGAYIIPLLIALAKFRKISSYHTWGSKLTAVLISFSVFVLLIMDMAWPFQVAAVIQVLVACEEIAITAILSEPRSNVRSLWHVLSR